MHVCVCLLVLFSARLHRASEQRQLILYMCSLTDAVIMLLAIKCYTAFRLDRDFYEMFNYFIYRCQTFVIGVIDTVHHAMYLTG